ncbi:MULTISPECIES: hypothetical protein [Kyrpidia]|uniref:Uncharacterized protein n=2 Tax=Kyrpidia spormannii TaxID=2055160 RepID=A0ACA8Z9M4_9BACL|nr:MULTISPECIES: hypothetical protein [Kyrpidia]MCL6577169.1 hypothetical protein [Kyrpidia sp.]CAB3391728.1 conserved protein of unknown function [Kyrpidia spormannii]CAB3392641.1 conserved protein of unknown function [Kyrpidia spormannii]
MGAARRWMRTLSTVLGIIGGIMTVRSALLRRRQNPAQAWIGRLRRRVM